MPSTPEVIVAGAGPVGLTAALSLAQAGIRVLVLEKRATLSTASLASTLHPPTLEIWDDLGVLAPVLHEGVVVETIQYRTPESVFAEFHMAALSGDTRFPIRLHLEQARVTPVMMDRLNALPDAEIRFGHGVVGVSQSADTVTARVAGPDGEYEVTAPTLLAADGAHSIVREAMGLAFDGITYPDKILRMMTSDDLDEILPGIKPITYLYNGSRSISFLRMPDCWRIILRVPKEVDDEAAMQEGWMFSRFQAVLPALTRLPTVIGKDVYGASRRVASRFRQGRVYLMGDAAHVTNTRGGMNMNCGVHDAVALARAVVAGGLDAAADERHRVATEELIPRTDRNVAGGPAWTDTLAETARDPEAARAYLRTAAMLDMLERPHG